MTQTDTYVPIDAVAEHLQVKVSTIRQWVKRGWIPRSTYLQVGKTYRFHLQDVVAALQKSNTDEDAVAQGRDDVVDSQAPVQLELDFGD